MSGSDGRSGNWDESCRIGGTNRVQCNCGDRREPIIEQMLLNRSTIVMIKGIRVAFARTVQQHCTSVR